MNTNDQAKLERIAEIKAQQKNLEAELKELTGSLEQDFVAGERVPTKDGFLRFDRNRRFNAKLAQRNLSEELYRGICTMQPNLKVAKQVLTGAELDDCYTEYAPKMVFVQAKDD